MKRFRTWLADRLDEAALDLWERARSIRPPYSGPYCPDCEAPEPECYCEERARHDDDLQAAFDAGAEYGGENAWREAQL